MHISKDKCDIHGEIEHYNGKCSICLEEEEKKELEIWTAKSFDERLLDLYLRIKNLEKGDPTF